jgi:hypothetical protein
MRLIPLCALLAACGAGRPPVSSPLLVASAPGATAQTASRATADSSPGIAVEHDHLVLDGVLPPGSGCAPVRGEWSLSDGRITVRLAPGPAPCAAGPTAWRARIGPLAPDEYRVRVVLDEREPLAERTVRIE